MTDRKLNDLPLEDTAVILYGENANGSQSRLSKAVLLQNEEKLQEQMNSLSEYADDDYAPQPKNSRELPLLCGQPPILYGAGTPQEAIVPDNWKQFDPDTGEGYQWDGTPSALGQQYINTTASTGGRYIAVSDGNYGLSWKNF